MIFSPSLMAVLHFLQKEQEMRVGDLGLRGTVNMGGKGNAGSKLDFKSVS